MGRDIKKLHPKFQEFVLEVVARTVAEGHALKYTECVRTEAEQNAYYKKGTSRAKYPDSFHCWGLAADFCNNVSGDISNKTVLAAMAKNAKAIAKERGMKITWGGDWKTFVDRYHVQWDDFGTTKQLKAKYGTPEKFMEAWTSNETPTTPPETKPDMKIGDKVIVKSGAKYTNGKNVPVKYTNKQYTVSNTKDKSVLIKELFSWVEKVYIEKTEAVATISYYPIYTGSGGLVSGLEAVGVDGSRENRRKIAAANGIANYQFTAPQNMYLLNLLRAGKLKK